MIVYKNVLVERKDTWLSIPEMVPVILNFNRSAPPVGIAILSKSPTGISADLYVDEGRKYGGLYPVIGFTAEKDMSTGKVTELSLCDQRNEDESIPPLPELSITVQRPKACKFCEHWSPYNGFKNEGECHLGNGTLPVESNIDGFEADCSRGEFPYLITGPDFYCCHFKQKDGI